ncbi:MAG: hypothetical protein F7C34_03610 [Desulfurococcales archaeon]|nr:hypothetical protein [Desulfurococcales archaeon]
MARVRLLASLREIVGSPEVEVEGETLEEVLGSLLREYPGLEQVIDKDTMRPRPGYIMFVDGVDIRLISSGKTRVSEIVILPVNHGGEVPEKLEIMHVSWEEIERIIEDIASKIRSSYNPEVIVAIIRGGLVPARLLSDHLGVDDILTLEIKLYEGIGVRGRRPYLRQPLTGEIRGKRVLLVDDISDTGLTLQLAQEIVSFYLPEEVKTAALYIKPWTSFVTDYYGGVTDKWVVFPWEKKEFQRLMEESQ